MYLYLFKNNSLHLTYDQDRIKMSAKGENASGGKFVEVKKVILY